MMSDTEDESDLDFSASEDEYIPTNEDDSDETDEDDETEETDGTPGNLSSSKSKKKLISRKINQDYDADSDSSVENYLVNPNEIDFSSDIFNPNKKPLTQAPTFDCNVGLNLSDSDEEVFDEVPSTSRDAAAKLLDFNHHANFNKQLERDKEQLRNLKSTNFGHDNCETDVSKLLAIGEPSTATSKPLKSKRRQKLESSDESDFEEVIEAVQSDNKKDVEVRIGPVIKQKPDRLQAEIEASIKRKINRVKKENQLSMHKVHLLSWIGYGNFVNKVLNSTKLLEMVVKLMPAKSCYPKEQTDQKYFEQIIKWYKTTVGLKNKEQNCSLNCLPPLPTSLALQIQSKMAICKKDFVFIFIVLLRSIGIQCRLVINLATVPIRPLAKDLCVISLKNTDKTKTGDDAKKTKQPSKKKKTATDGKDKEKDVSSKDGKNAKSKLNLEKLRSRGDSINGEISKVSTKSPETSNVKKSLKSKLVAAESQSRDISNDADKKMLKRRSVSVQNSSSVNNNIKRSRVTSSNDTTSAILPTTIIKKAENQSKDTSQSGLKRRSMSLQSPSSISSAAKTLSKFKSNMASKVNSTLANNSPIARRTRRRSVSKANETITSKGIPQLDGGDDSRRSKKNSDAFKIKFPLRSRSVSPTSSSNNASRRSKSVTAEVTIGNTLATKKSKPNLLKVKLPSRSRSISKSPTLEQVSRKSKLTTKSRSNDSSPSSPVKSSTKADDVKLTEAKNNKKVRNVSKSPTPSTSKAAAMKSNETSPSSPVKSSTKDDSKAKKLAKLTVAGDKNTKKARTLSKSPTPSTSKAATIASNDASPSLPVKSSTEDDSKAKKLAKLTVAGDKNTKKARTLSKSPTPSISKASSIESNEASPSSPLKSSTKEDSKANKLAKLTVAGDKNPKKVRKLYTSPTRSTSTNEVSPSSPVKSSTKDDSKAKDVDEDSKQDKPKLVRTVTKSTKPSTSKAVAIESNSVSPFKSKSVTAKATRSKTKLAEPTAAKSTTKSSKCTKSNKSDAATKPKEKTVKIAVKRKETQNASSDSDFAPTPKKKLQLSATEKPMPKMVDKLKKRIDRRILSTDDESLEPSVKKDDMNYWIEVYAEAESKWLCIDLFKLKVNCIDDLKKKATKPIAYTFAWNNNNNIKDVSPRYCSQWNTVTRKLRVPTEWLDKALSRYKEPISQRCVAEARELEEIHSKTPIPTAISELKNHPLYVLPRHLLKFEGIYPPNPVPVGYIRDEPIYSRLCVHTLHSREIWVKQARTVRPGENPYKIVKARPKWDRLANKMLEPQPLEIFGIWQTQPYEPPVAENGIVPRNAYGNVELFKPEMLPINTVHLRLPGLNRVCAKLKIDCAQAVVGFDFHGGSSHPTFDGFIVCEEFSELVTMTWWEEQAESERKAKEKQDKRIYDNWKKLIKGLLIRERLQRKYDFAGKDASSSKGK